MSTREAKSTIRLKPPGGLRPVEGYDFDHFALEFDQEGDLLDLRFELGALYDFYWAVPVEPGGRLRLIHVDSAVYHVDDYTVEQDPCLPEIPPTEWRGDNLGVVSAPGGDRVVVAVFVRASAEPFLYRCVVELREPDGTIKSFTLQNTVE